MSTSPDTLRSKYLEAYNLMICNLLEADSAIRVEAIENDCLDELLDIREDLIAHLEQEKEILGLIDKPEQLAAYLGMDDSAPCSVES